MYSIFLKIEEHKEHIKNQFSNIESGRSKAFADQKTMEYYFKLSTMLTTVGEDLEEFKKTDMHMLLGGEFRKHVWDLERLYSRYKDIPYHMQFMKRMWTELEEFSKDLKTLRKRINVFSYCTICSEPYYICREKDKDKCQFLESYERYKLHEPKFTDTCKGCEYVSVDVKHHINTGGCLKDKIKPDDILTKDDDVRADVNTPGHFFKYKKVKTALELEEELIDKEAKEKGLIIHMQETMRKKWICGYCKKGPGNGHSVDHRKCVFEGFDCDPDKWEHARTWINS